MKKRFINLLKYSAVFLIGVIAGHILHSYSAFPRFLGQSRDKKTNDISYSERDKKLNMALQAFYDRKYEKTISLAEEVLTENDKDALAWKRLGSAYYAIGDIKKAILYWGKSIKYDPSDEKLKLFVEKIKAEKVKPVEY